MERIKTHNETDDQCLSDCVVVLMNQLLNLFFKRYLGGSAVECLLLAQGVIPESWIEPHTGLPAWSLLLPLCLSVSLSLSLSLSLMNK